MKHHLIFLASAALSQAAAFSRGVADTGLQVNPRDGSSLCLDPALIQTASNRTGQENGTIGVVPGQEPSETDNANFISFCAGRQLTNGQQVLTGSCNGIPMGRIPAQDHMVATLITAPETGERLPEYTTFNITIHTLNLAAGHFANPLTSYFTAPQDLDDSGNIFGHCHVTVQELPSRRHKKDKASALIPDPSTFAFFKGISDAGDGHGRLQATVAGGLPAGHYRVCTMIAARNHQPVVMPVAQRGAQDDCVRFQVITEDGDLYP